MVGRVDTFCAGTSLDDRPRLTCEKMLQSKGNAKSLIVHCSIYEYAHRGLSSWLPEVLEQFALAAPEIPMIMFFHETYAFGPPWRSAFWLCHAQKAIIARLAKLASFIVTNTDHHAKTIAAMIDNSTPIQVLGTPSTIGEPSELSRFEARDAAAIVFGSLGTRQRVYNVLGSGESMFSSLGVTEILDVGFGDPEFERTEAPIRRLGLLEAREVSELMLRVRYGLIEYPVYQMAKSSVVAAYFAHGNTVINVSRNVRSSDGLIAGQHFLLTGDGNEYSIEEQAVIARSGSYLVRASCCFGSCQPICKAVG